MDKFFLKKPGQKIEIVKNQGFTKRDPLSWWAPLYVQMNITCSKIVRQVKDWDDEVPNDLNKEWLMAIDCLRLLDHMAIPRFKIPDKDKMRMRHEFHVFVDSSKTVAAAAVYLRTKCEGNIYAHLLATRNSLHSKSKNVSRVNAP